MMMMAVESWRREDGGALIPYFYIQRKGDCARFCSKLNYHQKADTYSGPNTVKQATWINLFISHNLLMW